MVPDLCVFGERAVIAPASIGRDRTILSCTATAPAGTQLSQASLGAGSNPPLTFSRLAGIVEQDRSRWPLLHAAIQLSAREAPPHPPSAAAI